MKPYPPAPDEDEDWDDDGPVLSQEAEARMWAEVERRMALGPAGRIPAGRNPIGRVPARRCRARRALLISAITVVGALGLAAVLALQPSGSSQDVTAAGPGRDLTWAELAEVAGDQPAQALGPNQVLSVTVDRLPTEAQRAQGMVGRREILTITGDGRGRMQVAALPDAPGAVAERDDTVGRPDTLLMAGLTPDQMAALPGEPEALRARLGEAYSADGAPLPPSNLLELLAVPVVPPPVRAAAVSLLAKGWTRLTGPTTDALGRPGLGVVAQEPDGERIEAVVDPATATLLSLRRHSTDLAKADPALTVYRSAVVVDA